MKKNLSILLITAAFLLTACDRGKTDLEQVLANKFSKDEDLKDYNIDPEEMADCVVNDISGAIPGLPGAPQRKAYFEAYTKLVTVKADHKNPQKVLEEVEEVFGSIRKAREAALGVTAFVLDCMDELVGKSAGL